MPASSNNRFIDFFKEFIHDSRAIGIVLLSCTVVSLLLSNVFIGENYLHFWHIELPGFAQMHLPESLLHFINDALMALFFFLAGMEIKREMAEGELASFKKSALPVFAALGGMLVPAIIFLVFTKNTDYSHGWAIPMATDIAFTLGVASLLGKRVPVALKVFLTALAIIDDLGAIVVIALFYGGSIKIWFLVACAILIFLIILLNRFTKKFGIPQFILGIILWYCMFNSGIHATVAGVVFAFLVPVHLLNKFEVKLHHIVYFIIMPIFALANTAIIFPSNSGEALTGSLSWGIMLGLFIGKPLGIFLFCYLLVKRKYAELPNGTNWNQLFGAGILAGIGFTMSIFISTLAFSDVLHQDIAKISVLIGSFAAMMMGYMWLRYVAKEV